MDKKMFHDSMEEIEVPKEDVIKAIQGGIRQGNNMKKSHPPRKRAAAVSAAAAAVLFISSGFLFPSVPNVLADIPFLAKLYEQDQVAVNLASQQLIAELNEKASYDGVDVTVTEAYFDGAVIGVTFDVKGDVEGAEDEVYAFYEIFDRDPEIEETMELVKLLPTEEGFKGHIQLSYPKAQLPDETRLPLNFIGIGEIKDHWKNEQGKWNFDVPIKQLPFETVALNKTMELDGLKVTFEKLISGNSSTALEYTVKGAGENRVDLELFDDEGNRIIGGTSDARIEKKTVDGSILEKRRLTIPRGFENRCLEIRISSGEEQELAELKW
ncbi:DUF4179 domain-containing protein [Mesobacillus subterraneus]|uniref:DUF4179 domain-containing protein n=1 Tax=Mesobacillus subterraneus TaxID=285983 RepID=A0A3R9FG37_9BACI|nr:DUF4179 domain-containing protein [Mesobacillus subterraneus]RSD27245.1 DUF4179 domain-containing protein [Mesobacillus subterraneus]